MADRPPPCGAGYSARSRSIMRGTRRASIVTGGVGESGIAEAAVMEAIAVAHGVPAARIVLEARATRTLESAQAVGALARAAGWRSVIVVSDPFHLWRSALLFRAEGLAVQTAATDDRYFSARSRRYYRVREMAALIVQTVNGEIPLHTWRQVASRRRECSMTIEEAYAEPVDAEEAPDRAFMIGILRRHRRRGDRDAAA